MDGDGAKADVWRMPMIRRAAVVLSSLAFTTLVNAGTAGAGPQLATERNRREALQVYRIGMELMSHEEFEKAAVQFSRAITKDPLLRSEEHTSELQSLRHLV